MLVIQAKMQCDHCERYQVEDVVLSISTFDGRLDLQFASDPPQGWRRDYTGYVVCVKCLETFDGETI